MKITKSRHYVIAIMFNIQKKILDKQWGRKNMTYNKKKINQKEDRQKTINGGWIVAVSEWEGLGLKKDISLYTILYYIKFYHDNVYCLFYSKKTYV